MADQNFSVNCGFFDAQNDDRTYSAEDMNRPYSRIVADGVFATPAGVASDDLQTIASGAGLQVTVLPGQGIFARKWFENPSSIVITVPANTSLYTRVDSVIAQVDTRVAGRVGRIVYRTGETANTPPEINTVSGVVEFRLANVSVSPSATVISTANITDLRGTASCPWVAGLIREVDTSTLFAQYQAAYAAYYAQATAEFEGYTAIQRQAWRDFMDSLTQEITAATNVLTFRHAQTTQSAGTVYPIGIASYDPETDILQVYKNGLLCVLGTDYTADAQNITFADAVTAGQTIEAVVLKSVISSDIASVESSIQTLDAKVSGSGWIYPTLGRDFSVYEDGSNVSAQKLGNAVYLRGRIKGNSSATAGLAICTLPDGYRPSVDHIYTACWINGHAVTGTCAIRVGTDGNVQIWAKSGSPSSTDALLLDTSFCVN